MLESLGYSEVPDRAEADLILFNTCSIREKADDRFVAHLHEAKILKRKDPERVIGVGGCWAQSVKEQVFRQFPFVDVAFGPGQVHKLAEFLTADSLTAQGYFEFEGFTGHLPAKRGRDFQGWVQISAGCNMKCSFCIVPSTRGREVSRPLEELVAEIEAARRRRRARGVAARPERQLLRHPAASAATPVLRAPGGGRRDRGHRPHPLHEPSSGAHERGRDPRPRRAALGLRAHPPAAAVGLDADPQGDAPHVRPRSLHGSRRPHPRARAGLRADHRHHRRLPGGDRGGLRGDAAGRRRGRLRRRLHLHLLAPPRHRGGDHDRGLHPARGRGRAHGASRGDRAAPRAGAGPALRRPHARRAGRGHLAHRREPDLAAARATTRSSTSTASRHPARSSRSRSPAPPARRSRARCRSSPAPAEPSFRRPRVRTYVRALGITISRSRARSAPAGLQRGRRDPPVRRPGGARHPLPRGPDQVRDQPRAGHGRGSRSSGR